MSLVEYDGNNYTVDDFALIRAGEYYLDLDSETDKPLKLNGEVKPLRVLRADTDLDDFPRIRLELVL